MAISGYQVNKVLRAYGEQLCQERISLWPKSGTDSSPNRVGNSAGAKRKTTIDKIAASIVDRITQHGPKDPVEKEGCKKREDTYGSNFPVDDESLSTFIFKEIDEKGETLHSLSLEDNTFLRSKPEKIRPETVEDQIFKSSSHPAKGNNPRKFGTFQKQDAGGAGSKPNVVDFSRTSRKAQLIKTILPSEPEIRKEKVAEIQRKIESGTYKLDYQAIANKMVDSFFDELF